MWVITRGYPQTGRCQAALGEIDLAGGAGGHEGRDQQGRAKHELVRHVPQLWVLGEVEDQAALHGVASSLHLGTLRIPGSLSG